MMPSTKRRKCQAKLSGSPKIIIWVLCNMIAASLLLLSSATSDASQASHSTIKMPWARMLHLPSVETDFNPKQKNNIKLCLSSSLEFAEVNGYVVNDVGEVEMIPANTTANREQKLIRIDPFDFETLGVPGVQRHDYEDFNSKLSELLFGQIFFSIISQNGWANTTESMETHSLVSWSTMTNAHVKLGFARNYYGYEVLRHFGGAIRNGFEPFVYISNDLVSLYAKCGDIKSFSKVFDEMAEKDLFLWIALIGEFNNNQLPQMALEFVDGIRSLLCDSSLG